MSIHIAKNQELSIGTETIPGTSVVPDVLYWFQNCSLFKKQNLNIVSENDGQRLLDTNIDQGSITVGGNITGVGSIYILDRFLRYILSLPTTSGTKNTFNAEGGSAASATIEVTKGAYAARYNGIFLTSLGISATAGENSSVEFTAETIWQRGTEVEKIKSISGDTITLYNEIVVKDTDSFNIHDATGTIVEEEVEIVSATDRTITFDSIPASVVVGGYISLSRRTVGTQIRRKKPLNLAESTFSIGARTLNCVRSFNLNVEANRTAIFCSGSYSSRTSNEEGIRLSGSFRMGVEEAQEFIGNAGASYTIEGFKAELKDGLGNKFVVNVDIIVEAMVEIQLGQEIVTEISYKVVDVNEISTDITL